MLFLVLWSDYIRDTKREKLTNDDEAPKRAAYKPTLPPFRSTSTPLIALVRFVYIILLAADAKNIPSYILRERHVHLRNESCYCYQFQFVFVFHDFLLLSLCRTSERGTIILFAHAHKPPL